LVAVYNSGGTLVKAYTYDGMGRLATETYITGSFTLATNDFYYNAGGQMIEQYAGANTLVRNFYSPVYVNAISRRDRDTDNNGSLDETLYFTSDANFNVTTALDTSGTVQKHMAYSPYGIVFFYAANFTSSSSNTLNFNNLWQGGWRDSSTGLMLFQARWYSYNLRWISADPAGYIDGASLYLPMGDNPINRVDALGQKWSYVPNMGTFDGSLQSVLDPKAPESVFALSFQPDRTKFTKAVHCFSIMFVQIAWFETIGNKRPIRLGTSIHSDGQGYWFIDSDVPPFYMDSFNMGNPAKGQDSSVYDNPAFPRSWGLKKATMKFETAAVNFTKGATYGDVYGSIIWGHSFSLDGAWNPTVTRASRYIGASTDPSFSIFRGFGYDPTLPVMLDARVRSFADVAVTYQGPGAAPSPTMQKFLDKYFP
jgi:RHS repeat-associated protein